MKLLPAVLSLALSGCYVTVPFQGLPRGAEAPPLEVESWVNAESSMDVDAPRERAPDRVLVVAVRALREGDPEGPARRP